MKKTLNHIAIIPDGNRRWAKSKKLPTLFGHRKGFNVVHELLDYIWEKTNIDAVTIWALSTENMNRTQKELNYLFRLYLKMIDDNLKDAMKKKIRITYLGRRDRLPKNLLEKMKNSEEITKGNRSRQLNIAIDYGGRDEILRAVKKIKKIKNLSEENFNEFLDTDGQPFPNPDLIIRTGGDMRMSGLMIWQAAYSEYYFLNKYLPDMTIEDLKKAIKNYEERERRFGK